MGTQVKSVPKRRFRRNGSKPISRWWSEGKKKIRHPPKREPLCYAQEKSGRDGCFLRKPGPLESKGKDGDMKGSSEDSRKGSRRSKVGGGGMEK